MNRPKSRVTTVLLARRAGALKRHLKGAGKGDGHDLHQARVASRRLREAVPVLTTGIKGSKAGKARRKIRRLTRALGTVRELDVTLKLLDELSTRESLPRLALEEVRAHVVRQREQRRELMLDRLQHVNVSKLDRRLVAVGRALAAADSAEWQEALASRLTKRAKALAEAIEEAGHLYAPERLHAVRIAAKKLRYTLELAADSGTKSAKAPIRTLKRLQDTLGRLRDLQVLQAHVAAVQAAPGRGTPRSGGLDAIHRLLEDECRHLHARYAAAAPSVQAIVETTRTLLGAPPAGRRRAKPRAVKMTLAAEPGRAAQGSAAATSRP